ncbi:MAG: hypothetical protein Q9219_007348 [cf. Caloplaca sp. 3 TL-2023]
MNVSNLLSHDAPPSLQALPMPEATGHQPQRAHQYPTRQSLSTGTGNQGLAEPRNTYTLSEQGYDGGASEGVTGYEPVPSHAALPKNIAFELLFDGPNTRARLPMRVQIFPHDTTDSILTTVKNFYGLYDGAAAGVSFEDEHGNTLIARYENLKTNMTVYVRVIPDYSQFALPHARVGWNSASPRSPGKTPHLDAAFQMPPPQLSQHNSYEHSLSRPSSRIARKRSASPQANRSVSITKHRSRSGIKSREVSLPRNTEDLNSDAVNGYSDSDGGAGSVTSSRKARSEQLASAEISVDNIVEGGRRKRAKFESSELPLFVPPQVPATNSISSISPQRRFNEQENPSPFAKPQQRAYSHSQPLQSPQSHGYGEHPHGIVTAGNAPYTAPLSAPHGHRLRERPNAPRQSYTGSTGAIPRPQAFGILPTPDPTVASCISDEDVALQLMRLGDASNISHGRTSASTLDDALSGRADVASSVTSDSDEDSDDVVQNAPPLAKSARPATGQQGIYNLGLSQYSIANHDEGENKGNYSCNDQKAGFPKSDQDNAINEFGQIARPVKSKMAHGQDLKAGSNSSSKRSSKISKLPLDNHKKSKIPNNPSGSKLPLSPVSVATQPRKTSSASTLNFQHHLGTDEEDLSSKPRCQRCRKSKKGCDRQRPCQRCKDAGIGIEGCISEDEGNGRKGRFGRHMGVSVKKDLAATTEPEPTGPTLAGTIANLDKSKKRKR